LVASKKLTITSGITHNTGASDAAAVNPVALIIDGTSLVHILDSELEELVLACEFTFIFLFFMAMVLCADVVYSFGCSSLN
jgi:phospholipid-transporting ATPase